MQIERIVINCTCLEICKLLIYFSFVYSKKMQCSSRDYLFFSLVNDSI